MPREERDRERGNIGKKDCTCLIPCQWIVEGLPSRLTNSTMTRSPALA